MRRKLFIWPLTWVCLAACKAAFAAPAAEQAYQQFFESFQRGAYAAALKDLRALSPSERASTKARYWLGVTQTKLQRLDLAAPELNAVVLADREGKEFPDAAFLLGQAYYANKNFPKARAAFTISVRRKYKEAASLYYLGYVQNLMNQDTQAAATFRQVLNMRDADEFQQAALFQLAELKYEAADKAPEGSPAEKKAKGRRFEKEVFPAYEKASEHDRETDLAAQAHQRISTVREKYGLVGKTTASGVARPAKAWMVRLTQDIKYDSNLTNQATGRLETVSYLGAIEMETSIFSKYEHVFANWIAVTPELSFDYTYHPDRSKPAIYTYDATSLTIAVRSRWDHKFRSKPAAALLEYEFTNLTQDSLARREQDFKAGSHNAIIGERMEIFPMGSTTVKGSLKTSRNRLRGQDYVAPKFSLGQNVGIGGGNIFNSTFAFERQIHRDAANDQRTYALFNSTGFPKLIWKTNVDLSFNITLTDTMHQFTNRGLEITLAPSMTLTREITKVLSGLLTYAYTLNQSRDKQSYNYRKHVIGLGVQATF